MGLLQVCFPGGERHFEAAFRVTVTGHTGHYDLYVNNPDPTCPAPYYLGPPTADIDIGENKDRKRII